jgi:hypothetical protein
MHLSNTGREILEIDVFVALDEAARTFGATDLRHLGVAQKGQDGFASDDVLSFFVGGHARIK